MFSGSEQMLLENLNLQRFLRRKAELVAQTARLDLRLAEAVLERDRLKYSNERMSMQLALSATLQAVDDKNDRIRWLSERMQQAQRGESEMFDSYVKLRGHHLRTQQCLMQLREDTDRLSVDKEILEAQIQALRSQLLRNQREAAGHMESDGSTDPGEIAVLVHPLDAFPTRAIANVDAQPASDVESDGSSDPGEIANFVHPLDADTPAARSSKRARSH